MPEVRRGSARVGSNGTMTLPSQAHDETSSSAPDLNNFTFQQGQSPRPQPPASTPLQPINAANDGAQDASHSTPAVTFKTQSADQVPTRRHDSDLSATRRYSLDPGHPELSYQARRSLAYDQREHADVYYDSRAATQEEYHRRAETLQDYYEANPHLLPQLPFTWHHGRRRYKLWLFAFICFVDASAVPIALYYGLAYAGKVEGWIIFAVVTTIWGGPTYLELAIRSLRLIKKERFYRPLGTNSRWCFDMTNWASILTVFVVTVLFIVGSAPHHPWLRVLCMPAPAILYCYGGWLLLFQLYHHYQWPAPFRLSSTAKGEPVKPPVYYFMEDVIAVNAAAGRPYREALAARYNASPRFRRMLYVQSWFWSIPPVIVAIPLTIIAVIPPVPATAAYGICWAIPFLWCCLWGCITIRMCKKAMVEERLAWEADDGVVTKGGLLSAKPPSEGNSENTRVDV